MKENLQGEFELVAYYNDEERGIEHFMYRIKSYGHKTLVKSVTVSWNVVGVSNPGTLAEKPILNKTITESTHYV